MKLRQRIQDEIVAGKPTWVSTSAEDTGHGACTDGPVTIEDHPGTVEALRLVRFLAGVYNGSAP
jgi:hypothetical protein